MKKNIIVLVMALVLVVLSSSTSLAAFRLQLPVFHGEHQFGISYEQGTMKLTGSEVLEWPTQVGTVSLILDAVQPITLTKGQQPVFERICFQGELAFTRPQWGIDWSIGIRSRWQPGVEASYGAFLLTAWGW